MRCYSLSHLTHGALTRDLATIVARDRGSTALLLAHLAEFHSRRLHAPAGYESMYAYCLGELHMSEDSACRRIRAARAAREFPVLFEAIADGRLHLSAVVALAPWLISENVGELVAAAVHKSKAEVERLLAERFPRPERPSLVQEIPAPADPPPLGPQVVDSSRGLSAPARVTPPAPSKITPVAPQRFEFRVTMDQALRDKLEYAKALLSRALPSGSEAAVLDRALDALIGQLEKQRFAATDQPRPPRRSSANPRHIPADVKRAVWARDGGRCTFVSETGRRCQATKLIEFDHVTPVAHGGRPTVEGLRLRCRTHNQYAAERAFGAEFMRRKRETAAEARRKALAADPERSVIPWLRRLGIPIEQARYAAERCDLPHGAPLEDRVRMALSMLAPGRPRTPGASSRPTSS